VQPNAGHRALAEAERQYDIHIVTQNVDDLHERAGSKKIMHLHGELRKVRSTGFPKLIYHWEDDLHMGDLCEKGTQLRPHIVWFGEAVPLIEPASEIVSEADVVFIIGTSLQVYPAAGLVSYAQSMVPIFYIDPKPQINYELGRNRNVTIIEEPASTGVAKALQMVMSSGQ
jgi:NAD-dependent deacetylase